MLLATNKFDLVVTMLELGSVTVVDLAQAIKNQYPSIPSSRSHPLPPTGSAKNLRKRNVAAVDYLYYWQGTPTFPRDGQTP
jgi:hypothetical protein